MGSAEVERATTDIQRPPPMSGEGDDGGRPDVFASDTFSAFCLAYYDWWRGQRPKVRSWAWLAQRLGLPQRDRNYLRNICSGLRLIPDSLIDPLADAFQLDQAEKTFFRTLAARAGVAVDVQRNRARLELNADDMEAKERLERLLRLEEDLSADIHSLRRIRAGEGKAAPGFLARWWYVVIRELAQHDDFRADPQWIASRVWPTISADDAADALEFLVEHDLLEFDEETLLVTRLDDSPIVQDSDPSLRQYHWDFGAIASQSLELPATERFLGGLTFSVPEEQIDELHGAIKAFGMDLLRRFSAAGSGRVMHVAFRSFPLTRPKGDRS
jgi:uncharacterized protein (TIGR02147 family)